MRLLPHDQLPKCLNLLQLLLLRSVYRIQKTGGLTPAHDMATPSRMGNPPAKPTVVSIQDSEDRGLTPAHDMATVPLTPDSSPPDS